MKWFVESPKSELDLSALHDQKARETKAYKGLVAGYHFNSINSRIDKGKTKKKYFKFCLAGNRKCYLSSSLHYVLWNSIFHSEKGIVWPPVSAVLLAPKTRRRNGLEKSNVRKREQ